MENFSVQNRSSQRRGAVLVMTMVIFVTLLAMAALTIDVGYMFNVRAELQNAADAAALAGASGLPLGPIEVRKRAKEYAKLHVGMAKPDVQDKDVYLGRWDASTKKFTVLTGAFESDADGVRVVAQMSQARGNPIKFFFAPILGVYKKDVSASATASFGTGQPWNVVITQDITSSFVKELPDARLADQALLDCIHDHTNGQSLVGLVAFTGFGSVLSPLKTVGAGYSALSKSIGAMKSCGSTGMPKCSGTNIGVGIDSAISLLKGLKSDYPPAIMIVSDGQPQSSSGNPGYTDQALKNWAVASANKADALGISVFTLFYGGNDTSVGAADFLASLVRGKGTAHSTLVSGDMATELGEMCQEGLPLILVE